MTLRALALALAMLLILTGAMAEEAVSEDVEVVAEETTFDLLPPEGIIEKAAPEPESEEENLPKAGELQLSATSTVLGVGETLPLLPDDWTGESLPVFETSNKKIVTVSADGVIKGVKKGSATVRATLDGVTASCAVQVMKAPSAIVMDATRVSLGYDAEAGTGERLTLVPTLTKETASHITYSGYDPSVIAVEGDTLIAVGIGATQVTASTFNGKQATVAVTVLPGPSLAAFSPEELIVGEGVRHALKVVVNEGSAASAWTYESSAPSVATVDEDGVLTALSQGTAQITARAFNGITTTCDVTVMPAPKAVFVSPAALTLGVGELSAPLDVTTDIEGMEGSFTYVSSKPKYVVANADGTVKGVKKGSATVTVKAGNGVSAALKVTVVPAPKALTLSPKTLALAYEPDFAEQAALKATLTKNTASAITYSGYDPDVVSVDADGTVTAVGVGTTTITGRTFNGKSDSVTVTVQPGPTRLELDRETLSLGMGESATLKVTPVGGAASVYEFESSDPGVVTVDEDGKLAGVAAGTARITARAFNGVSASCEVTVTPAPTRVIATPESMTLGVGEVSAPITAVTDADEGNRGFTFTTANKKYATVSSDGAVKAVKKGSTSIRVEAYNGVYTTVKVTVKAAPKSMTLDKKTLSLAVGSSARLTATLSKDSGGTVYYSSDNEAAATVDDSGNVTAVGPGTARITARTFNGKTDVCAVTVTAPAQSIQMADTLNAVTATYTDFDVKALDAEGRAFTGAFNVSFDPAGIAEWDEGRVLGLAEGQTVMTVSSGEASAKCTVSVVSYKSVHGVQSIAHRGGSGYWPENTLEAFRNAASTGADGVELDARSTKDGYQVIHHDATFTVGGKKYTISKLKLSEFQSLKPSAPTLDEALEALAATKLDIHLELKDNADGAKCVKAVRAHGLEDRTVYFSFYEPQLKQVYAADPSATLGMSLNSDAQYDSEALLAKVSSLHLKFFVANKALMTQTVTDYWHRLGIKISVWTPNTRDEVKKLCALGVDYILSDYPDYCVEYR